MKRPAAKVIAGIVVVLAGGVAGAAAAETISGDVASEPPAAVPTFSHVLPTSPSQANEPSLVMKGDAPADEVLTRDDAVVLSDSELCVEDEGGASCVPPEAAFDGYLVSVAVCDPGLAAGESRVFGALPDGVDSVTVAVGTERATIALAVVDNIYDGIVDGVPAKITWIADSQERTRTLPSSGMSNNGCA